MKKFIEEFKAFALRGNMMDMAVGVIIGSAFSGIVTSLTDVFYRILMRVYDEGLFRFLDGAELDLVFRKYGEAENIELEKTFSGAIKHLFSFFYIEDENDIAAFSEGYKALMYLLLSADRLDGKEKTLRFLIRGLVLQMVE